MRHTSAQLHKIAMAAPLKVASRFNMRIPAGKATPQPPVGSALGQRGPMFTRPSACYRLAVSVATVKNMRKTDEEHTKILSGRRTTVGRYVI